MSDLAPLQEGLYAVEDGAPRLLASACDACQRVFFPRRQYCGKCTRPGLRELRLASRGTLVAWSLIDRKPKLAVIEPPYVQAEVAMPEGVSVFTVLDCKRPEQLRVGQAVELFLAEVPAPGGEGRVQAYMFRPVSGEGVTA